MQTRKENPVIRQEEGPAIRQDTRATAQPAMSRKTRPSVAELQDCGDFESPREMAAVIAIGTVFLFAFMWLAAAY